MKTLCTISIAAASLFAAGTAQAQYQAHYGSNSAPWSYDGQTQYASQADCERARTTRTLGGAAVGGLIGAGLGAFAGGDDRRNSVVGAAVGAATGGYAGNRSLKCEQTSAYAPSQQPTYTGYSQQPAQVYYPQQQPQTVYNQPTPYPVYQTSYPAPVTTTRTRTVYTAPAPTRTVYSQPTYTTHAPSHTSSSTTRRVYTQTQTYPSQQHQYGGYQTASYPTRTPVYTPVQQQRSPVYTHDNR
ncbi:MAG: YMGG-like glycine zipper-containing protein, partial [Pseudomonadota bacterium]